MKWRAFLWEPLEGKTSLTRVVWLYGVVGSLVYGVLEMFLDPANTLVMHSYIVGGLIISVYTAVATYRCAGNCRSKFWTRSAQLSAVLSLVLMPLFAYWALTGALDLALIELP